LLKRCDDFIKRTGKKVLGISTRTTIRITEQIITLCNEIDKSQKPYHVPVKPESWVESKECFFNVKAKVEKDGGKIQFGWAIWEWPNVMIEAEFHAIWISPENTPVDITPNAANMQKILFLPDNVREYDYSSEYYRVDNNRHPLSNNPLILDLIKISEQIFEVEERLFPGQQIDSENPAFGHLEELKEKKGLIQLQLMSQSQPKHESGKPGRNTPCPCGSGLKFKKCCGKQ
jgi:hypothetical protein